MWSDPLCTTFTTVFSLWNKELCPTLVAVLGHGHAMDIQGYSPMTAYAGPTAHPYHRLSRMVSTEWHVDVGLDGVLRKRISCMAGRKKIVFQLTLSGG